MIRKSGKRFSEKIMLKQETTTERQQAGEFPWGHYLVVQRSLLRSALLQ
jgi:hypothetical protein